MGFTEHVSPWVSITWIVSAVFISVSRAMELHTVPQVIAQCGENVTLTCEARQSRSMDIKVFSWVFKNRIMCEYENGLPQHKGQCENSPQNTLKLTLTNVMPVDMGKYLCKIRSTVGGKSSPTHVIVQECTASRNYSINSTQATCWFSCHFPLCNVHWSQGDLNLTDSARTEIQMDQYERQFVVSTIDLEPKHLTQSYQCRLWPPSDINRLSFQTLTLTSTGHMFTLQWICAMVEILLLTFLT
nr:uncharacterized protein LOC109996496 [Labrus bergylta]XP_029136381.1 uncharacterized protein LOC109996496 [Labrus bergylta]